MENVIRTLEKKTRNCPNGRQDLRTDFVLYVTLCHLMETYCGVFYFILIFFASR